ncbi:hypothetical protein MO867_21365, partial [Microbulbifer sp. OS29]
MIDPVKQIHSTACGVASVQYSLRWMKNKNILLFGFQDNDSVFQKGAFKRARTCSIDTLGCTPHGLVESLISHTLDLKLEVIDQGMEESRWYGTLLSSWLGKLKQYPRVQVWKTRNGGLMPDLNGGIAIRMYKSNTSPSNHFVVQVDNNNIMDPLTGKYVPAKTYNNSPDWSFMNFSILTILRTVLRGEMGRNHGHV